MRIKPAVRLTDEFAVEPLLTNARLVASHKQNRLTLRIKGKRDPPFPICSTTHSECPRAALGMHITHSPSATKYQWQPYGRTYYPGVSDAGAAKAIAVDSVEAVTRIDWTVGVPLRARVILGVVVGPDDKPTGPVFVELKADGYEENAALAETTKDGVFSLEGLTELQYFVQASSARREGSEAWHCHKLAVPGANEVLTIKLDRPGKDCDTCRRRR